MINLEQLKNLSILYVEDEALIRQNAIEFLSRYCDNVFEAEDGEEGFQIYQEEKPDIIISDIKMPKLNGLDFATKIRKTDKKTPIIMLTAHTQTDYLLKAVELQLIKYLVKPLSLKELKDALLMAIEILAGDSALVILNSTTQYDRFNQTLFVDKNLIRLTYKELLFFDFLLKHKDRVITYDEIEKIVWAYDVMSKDAIRSLVRSVRRKTGIDFIDNVSGMGYRLMVG